MPRETGKCALAFFSLGYTLCGLVSSTRAVVVIGNVVLHPLMIFSGAMVPLEVMSDIVLTISRFLPVTYFFLTAKAPRTSSFIRILSVLCVFAVKNLREHLGIALLTGTGVGLSVILTQS